MKFVLWFGMFLIVYGLFGGSSVAMVTRGGGNGGQPPPQCPGATCDNGCRSNDCNLANCADAHKCGCSAPSGGPDCAACNCNMNRDGACNCV